MPMKKSLPRPAVRNDVISAIYETDIPKATCVFLLLDGNSATGSDVMDIERRRLGETVGAEYQDDGI